MLKLRVHNNNNKRRKLEWRRAHYSETNHGPLTRLTLFVFSFVVNRCVKCVQETCQGRVGFLSKGRCINCFVFFLAVVEVVRLPLIKLEITIYLPHCDEKLKWNTLQLKTETRAARK